MTVKKSITYITFDLNGNKTIDNPTIELNVQQTGGNYLIHKDMLRHRRSNQQNTTCTKTRSEVRGGGRKPWRQKGTGRARAGSNRSPLWKGGGVIFGPKLRHLNLKLNKKERKLALQTLLYNKRKNILVVNDLESAFSIPKTKEFQLICKKFDINLNKKILLIVTEKNLKLKLTVRNIKTVELISVDHLNTVSLLKAQQILLTSTALQKMKEKYNA